MAFQNLIWAAKRPPQMMLFTNGKRIENISKWQQWANLELRIQ